LSARFVVDSETWSTLAMSLNFNPSTRRRSRTLRSRADKRLRSAWARRNSNLVSMLVEAAPSPPV